MKRSAQAKFAENMKNKSETEDGVPDLSMLINLEMKTVLHNLEFRYSKMPRKYIYTSVSTILLAINPYERLPIYGQDVVNEFHAASQKGTLPMDRPHPYGVAARSYMRMIQRKCNQSIIVCGESGSGKSETGKLVMRYLAMTAPSSSMESSIVEQQIIAASPILEAYGNAKTILNNNSSRFAKFTKVLYDVPEKAREGHLLGSYLETFLLEKSRVIFQSNNERNYHIPYFLFRGLPQTSHEELGIIDPKKWWYAYQGYCDEVPGINDVARYEELKECFSLMRMDESIERDLYSITSGLFNLGNIASKREDDGFTSLDPRTQPFVETVARLWGVEVKAISDRLTTASMKVMKKLIVKKVQYADPGESSWGTGYVRNRDSTAKEIYGNIFSYLCERINAELYQTDADDIQSILFIGVLDVFGFQNVSINSFEQFCMNFCNEKLQQFFNYHIIRSEQEEYIKESVVWTPIVVPDNLTYINFVENREKGFFTLLDSACKAPQPSVEAFMQQLFKTHAGNKCIRAVHRRPQPAKKKKKKSKKGQKEDKFTGFAITHFADEVTYDASQFLTKNMEAMHPDTSKMLKKSRNQLLKEIGSTGPKGRKKKSESAVFWGGIRTLMKNLNQTEPYFVFCVNPNRVKSSKIWEMNVVQHQLRCSGLVEALKVLKLGYPTRVPYYTLYDRYHGNVTHPLIKNMGPEAFSTALLIAFDVNESDYCAGLTKIFFKPSKAAVLDTIMSQAGKPLTAQQNDKITKWVVAKRVKQLIGICKAFLKYKQMVNESRSSAQIVQSVEKTLHAFDTEDDKLRLFLKHKDHIITFFLQNKIDLINFAFTEDDFVTELKQHCKDELLHDALKVLYAQIQRDVKELEEQNINDIDDDDTLEKKDGTEDMSDIKISWEDKLVSECMEHIQCARILPPGISIDDTALFKQQSVLQMEKDLLNKNVNEIESSCTAIQTCVRSGPDPMISDQNPFKLHEHKSGGDMDPLQDMDKPPMEEDDASTSTRIHKYEACRVRFEEELHAKTAALHKTKSTLEMMENQTKSKKCKCKCVAMKKITKSVAFTAQVASRALSLVDIVTDSYLLYTASRVPELWFLTLTLVLSISSSYIISYSSGVQLYLFRHTFDSLKGFKKLLMTFFILPTGILYFVFLDLADIYLRLFRWMYFVLCCKSIQEMQQYEQILAAQLGMDRMNWEGFKAQRSIGQLMFESIPQFIVQTIVFYYLDLDSMMKGSDDDIASSNAISETQLLISIVSALVNIIGTILRLKIDSICCKTDLISYSLNCVKARVDWIPQLEHILDAIKNKTSTSIDFQMSYKLPCCLPHTRHVEYDFSVTTVNRLISELRAIDVSDYYISEHDDGKLLQMHFRDSLRLLPLQSTIELLAICQEKGVKVLSVDSKKAKNKYDWFSAIKISKAHGQDVQLLEHSRDDEGLPYIMKLMKLTDIEERRTIFRDLIEHDFDLNIHDLVTNESIVFTLIRSYDYKNLKYLFEHYSSNKGVLLRVNYHNKDGISPLGVALSLYPHEHYIRSKKGSQKHHQIPFLWEILFQHGAQLSFPSKIDPNISPLMFAIKRLRNKSLARSLMQNGAPLYGKETTSLNELFVNYELEDEEHWSEEKASVKTEEDMKVETRQNSEMIAQEEKYQLLPLEDAIKDNSQMDHSWVALLCDVVQHTGHSLKSIADNNADNPLHFFIKHSNIKHIKRKRIQQLKLKRLKHLIFACKEWERARNNDNAYPYQLILKQEDEYLFFALADFDQDFIRHIMSEQESTQQLMGWIIHILQRVTTRYPKGLRRRNHRVNIDRDVQCLDQIFQRYLGPSDIQWPNKYTVSSSVDGKSFDLMDVCLDKALVDAALFLKKYWKFELKEQQRQKLDTIRQENAQKRVQNEQARFESILAKREIDPLFDYLDNHSNFRQNILTNREFVLQIIEWIINITQNIIKKYSNGITDDIRVIGDVDIQTLDRLFNGKYFGKKIRWPLSSDEHEIELMDVCLERKLYEVTLYLNRYWNISMDTEQEAKLDEIKPATPIEKEDKTEAIEVEPFTDDIKEQAEKKAVDLEPTEAVAKLDDKANKTGLEIKEDYDSDTDTEESSSYDSDDDEEDEQEEKRLQRQRLREIRRRHKGTPPPIYNAQNAALDEEDDHKGAISVSNHQNIDKYNKAKQFALSLSPFTSLKSSIATQSKASKQDGIKKGESHKIEILYSFLVESLSVADLITDILVVKQLIEARQVWWISFMFLFMVSPYLVSHSTMCSLISVRRSHYLPKQTKCPPIGLFTLNVLSLVLLTPFAIIWFSLVDMIFMLYLVISSLIFAVSAGYLDISNVMDDLLFQRVLGMTKMEVIGYRRLRTLSQLLFETFPQILLQIRILVAIRYEGQDEFNITTDELWLSIIIAFVHVFLELAIIYLDARASKMTLSHYAVACLAARLHWIPFLTQIADKQSRVSEAVFDFEVIQYKVWFFCNNTYRIKYEFTPSSFKKLGERIMKLPVFASLNAPSNHILSSLWTEYHVAHTMPVIKLGKTCCRSLNLDLFPLFFRSAEKRIMIETCDMDWKRIIFKFKRSAHYSSDNGFLKVLLTEFLNFVEVELIIQLAIELKMNDVDIKCDILQQLSVSSDILRILKKYYDHGVYFGLNPKVTRSIYKLMDDNKWSTVYETDTSYIYVIILMLWYTRRTVYRHQDPKASIKFIDDPKRHQWLQKVHQSVLPKSFIIQYQTNRSNEEDDVADVDETSGIKVPFEILECFAHFQSQIETFLIQLTAGVHSEAHYMCISDKELFKYFSAVCDAQSIEFLRLVTNAPWNVIQQMPAHLLFCQLFCKLDPIILRLEMVHGFGRYLLSSAIYRETRTVSTTLQYENHSDILHIPHHTNEGHGVKEDEEEKHSISGQAGEIEMKTMMENEILLSPPSQTVTASHVMGIARIEIEFDGFECRNVGDDVPSMGVIQLFTVLPTHTKNKAASEEWILNKIVLAEISFERVLSSKQLIVDLYANEVLGTVRPIYTAHDCIQLMPLKLSIKGSHDAIDATYTQIRVEITYLLGKFKDVSLVPFENLTNKVYELQNVQLAKFVNKYKDELAEDETVNRSQNALHMLCDLDDPNVEIFEMILHKATGHDMVNKVRFDGKTPLKVLQDNMRMDSFKKSEMLQRLLSHRNIQTVTKQKTVVIVGCRNSGKHTLMKQLQIYYKTNRIKRKASYKLVIIKFIIATMKTLIKHCGDPKIAKLKNKDALQIGTIKTHRIQSIADIPIPYDELFASIQKLWNQRAIKRVYTDIGFMIDMAESVQYFLDFRLKMIQDASYIPSDLDILMLPHRHRHPMQSTICTVNDEESNNELQIRWIVHSSNKILKLSSIYNYRDAVDIIVEKAMTEHKRRKSQFAAIEDDLGRIFDKEDVNAITKDVMTKVFSQTRAYSHFTPGIDTVIFMISLTSFVEMNVLQKTDNNFLNGLKMYKRYCLDPKFNATKFVVILNKTDMFQRQLKNKKVILQQVKESMVHKSYDEWLDLMKAMFTAQCPSRTFFFYDASIASDPKSLSIIQELEDVVLKSSTVEGLPVKYHRMYTFLQQIELESYYPQFIDNRLTQIKQLESVTTNQLQSDIGILNLSHRLKLLKHIKLIT